MPKFERSVVAQEPVNLVPVVSQNNLPLVHVEYSSLPSKGLSYPTGLGISYVPYTFGEVKKISQSKMSIVDSFELVMRGITADFDIKQLTLSDFYYIGLLRKISTTGTAKFEVRNACSCGELLKSVMDLEKIEFLDLNIPKLPLIATINNKDLHFSPITVGGFIDLVKEKKEEDDIAIIAYQIINLPFNESYDIVDKTPASEYELFNEVDKMLNHGVKPIVLECPKCKKKKSIDLDGGETMILPFRESKEPIASRIRFGLLPSHTTS